MIFFRWSRSVAESSTTSTLLMDMLALLGEQLGQSGMKIFLRYRLGQVGVAACHGASDAVDAGGAAGQHDHLDLTAVARALDALANLVAVHVRQGQVEKNDVERLGRQPFEGGFAGFGEIGV